MTDDAGSDTMTADPEPKAKRKHVATGKPKGRPRKASLEAPLREMLQTVGTVWNLAETAREHPSPSCGAILTEQAASIAAGLNAVALDDPTVYKWLDAMMTGGGWGSVVLATWPVAQAVLSYHVVPAVAARRAGRFDTYADGPAYDEPLPPNEGPGDDAGTII